MTNRSWDSFESGASREAAPESPLTPPGSGSAETSPASIDTAFEGAAYLLDAEGIVRGWSPRAERLTGFPARQMTGSHFRRFHEEGIERGLSAALRDGRDAREGWCLRRDGSRFWARTVLYRLDDADGTARRVAGVTSDASSLAADADAQKAEAMAAVARGIAHDFNNLLTIICNNTERLLTATVDAERAKRLLEGAYRAAQRGSKLTQEIHAFAASQSLRGEVYDINSLVAGLEAELRGACDGSIKLGFALASAPLPARLDRRLFETALRDLVANARDAMPAGGSLSIETTGFDAAGDAAGGAELRPYAAVRVADTGVGMTPEVRSRAIEPFFSTKKTGIGAGFGLPRVYGFVRRSGGRLSIASDAGVGSTVTMLLPLLPRDPRAAKHPG